MARQSAILFLLDGIQSYFTARSITANVSLGWREYTKQSNQGAGGANRVVLIPGGPGGDGGALNRKFGKTGPGGNPRPLLGWARVATLAVWAVDRSDPNNEAKQIQATEDLFESAVQAIHRKGRAAVDWGRTNWAPDPTERKFGLELSCLLGVGSVFYDLFNEEVTPAPNVERGDLTT